MFREIRSLADEHFIAVVNEAVASYCPWENPTVQDQNKQANNQCLLYRESGKLENYDFPAASGQFTRQYLYKFSPVDSDSNNLVQVFHCSKMSVAQENVDPLISHFDPKAFKEEDFFHNLVFPKDVKWDSLLTDGKRDPITAAGQHLCGRDVYNGVFTIYSKDNFKTSWKVTGPEKSFQIVSIYTKLP